MEQWKLRMRQLLFPPKWVVILLTLFSAAALTYIFLNGLSEHPLAYIVYPLSFYALCTLLALMPAAIGRCRTGLYANQYSARYLTERELRMRLSLYNGTAFNLAFGLFKLVIGIVYRSAWFGAVGIYYMVLSLMRYLLLRKDRALRKSPAPTLSAQWQSYRICGGLLLMLNAAMSGIVIQIIRLNESYYYPGFVIYASAAYTFYRLTIAIIQSVRLRKQSQPLFTAAKHIDLSAALMSIFALQTAMFTTFGGEMTKETQNLMNSMTGGSVCCIVVCLAVFMLVKGHREHSLLPKD